MCAVENYVEGWKDYFANKVYAVVDKVFYQSGQDQLTKHVMPERCDVIGTKVEESPRWTSFIAHGRARRPMASPC